MTLVSVYNSDGCVGRCDAQCYDAKHLDCDCVCGGANHGKGEAAAMENARAHGKRWAAEIAERSGVSVRAVVMGDSADQMGIVW